MCTEEVDLSIVCSMQDSCERHKLAAGQPPPLCPCLPIHGGGWGCYPLFPNGCTYLLLLLRSSKVYSSHDDAKRLGWREFEKLGGKHSSDDEVMGHDNQAAPAAAPQAAAAAPQAANARPKRVCRRKAPQGTPWFTQLCHVCNGCVARDSSAHPHTGTVCLYQAIRHTALKMHIVDDQARQHDAQGLG
jgi:hypothetical protein